MNNIYYLYSEQSSIKSKSWIPLQVALISVSIIHANNLLYKVLHNSAQIFMSIDELVCPWDSQLLENYHIRRTR